MLTRRHIRVKVMQSIYAMVQSEDDGLDTQRKFLFLSIEQMENLYLLILSFLIALRKLAEERLELRQQKYLATDTDKNPNTRFINNKVLKFISDNQSLLKLLGEKKIDKWELGSEYVRIVYETMLTSDVYKKYMASETTDFGKDKTFLIDLFREVIAPNDKLYEYIEDQRITWIDDLPLINTLILKKIQKMHPNVKESYFIQSLYKDVDDKDFTKRLFDKTLLHDKVLIKEIEGKTPNWDKERIAEIDEILLKMAICEFLYFPSIPVKVTINEYLEIAKEYSTPKSSIFVNGILDKLVKEYQQNEKLNKSGRGLR